MILILNHREKKKMILCSILFFYILKLVKTTSTYLKKNIPYFTLFLKTVKNKNKGQTTLEIF